MSDSLFETLKFDYTPTPTKTLHTKPLTQKGGKNGQMTIKSKQFS